MNTTKPSQQNSSSASTNKVKNQMIATLLLSLVGIIALLVAFYREFAAISDANSWIFHSQQVRTELLMAFSDLQVAQSGKNGYVLTGKSLYLEAHNQGLRDMERHMQSLKSLTQDNPNQQKALAVASRLIDETKEELALTIDIRKRSGFEPALERVQTGRGKQLMDALRAQFHNMREEEDRLLALRNSILSEKTTWFINIFMALAAAVVLLLSGFVYFMWRYLTDRDNYQRDISAQKALFSSVLNSLADGVMVANKQGEFVVVNPAANLLTGICEHKTPPEDWSDIYGCYSKEDSQARIPFDQLPLVRSLKGESIADEEIWLQNPHLSSPRWLSVSSTPVISETGDSGLAVVIFRDITERKTAEKRITEFISMVSHELRTPLTSIKGALRIIDGGLAGDLSDRAGKLIKVASSETERLIRLVNDILDLRKIEEGKLELKVVDAQIQSLIERAIEGVSGMLTEQSITIQQEINARSQICCDEDRVIQVIVNLLSNAIKFSPAGGSIAIKVDAAEPHAVRFSVTDQGSGISSQGLAKLFGRFQQVDSSNTHSHGGSGLGLAISRGIVREHGGKIGVESELGHGSTFWFELPTRAEDIRSKNS